MSKIIVNEPLFWAKVRPTGFCWEWTASTVYGYGQFMVRIGDRWAPRRAHRLAYGLLVGPIPDGMDLDHLCRNHTCVNPDHLVPKTRRDNTLAGFNPAAQNARKQVCKQGHEFTEANTYSTMNRGRPGRSCRTCHANTERERRRIAHAERMAKTYELERPPRIYSKSPRLDSPR